MKLKAIVALVSLALICVSAPLAAAGTGNLKVKLFNESGVPINGKITAAKGSSVKTCTTSAGTCTMSGLSAGTWVVTAKVGTKKGGPKSKAVVGGQTSTLTLQVVMSSGSR